jgi:hypothetical protein
MHGHRRTVLRSDDPAALIGRLGARVGDDLVEEPAGDAQGYFA